MSQISATDDLRLRIRQRLEAAQPAAQPTAGADPLRMAIRQRLAAMQPQQPQPFSAGDPLGQGATGTQWPTQPSRSVLGEFTAAAESGIGRLAGMTGLVPMPDDFRPSPAPEGASRVRRIAQTGAGIAGQAAPAVVAGIGTAGLAAPAVAGLGALAPAVGMSGTLASQMAGGAAAGLPAGALGAATTYERTGSPLAAASSGLINTAAGAVPVFSATGRLPVNIAADAAIQGGTNVATAYGDEQIARAAGAAPMEVDPLAAFAAGAGMTAGTRGLPAAARAIGDRLPVRELPMGTLEPVDALAAYQDAYRNAPDPNAIPVQALSRADLSRLQPNRGPILGDSLPLSDGPTAAPIGIAPAEVNADPGIPLVSPETPSAATLSLPALRAEAERLGVLRQGPRDRASLAQRVDQARAGIAVDDGTPKVPALYPDATQVVTTRSGGIQGDIETPPTDPLNTPVNVPGDTAPPEVAARTPIERAPNGNRLQEEGRPEGLLSPPRAETVTGAGEQPAPGIRATQNVAQPTAQTAQPPNSPEIPDRSNPARPPTPALPRERPLAEMTLPEIRQEARQLGVFEGGPRSREALATRIEATRAERRRGRTTGEEIGLKQTEIDRIRTETGLSELPEPERRGWEEVLNRAKNEGQADKAIQTANEVVKSGRPTTDVEHAGMVLKAAELANDYDAAIADMNRLIDSRDDGGARLARERANSIMQQIETLTDASDQGGREAARALSIRRMLVNRESFELAPVVQRAQQVKGSKLTSAEHAKLEAVTKAHAEAEARVKELESKWREAELAKARAEAKRTLEREARTREVGKLREQAGTARSERDAALREASQTSKASERLQTELAATQKALADAKQARTHARTERISTTRQKLATERQEILAKIRALGYRANAGFDPTFYYHLGRLAINYVHEGVLTLDEVVAKVREHVPDATDRDVYEALNARDPKRQARARSDAQKRVQELRTQARLLAKIDRASAGMLDTPKAKPPASQQIRALRSQLTQLRVQAYKATADATKLERAVHLITEIQNHLDNGTRPAAAAKKGSTTPAELQQARQKIRDLKSLMRATDQIASLRQQIQSGEFVIPETAPVREVPRELDRARIELRKARSAVRQAIEEQRPWTTRRAVAESMNTLRAVKATADVSATLRQGLVLGASRPGTAVRAFGKAVRAMLDANTELQIDDAIRSRPTHYLGERAGLYLSDVQGAPNAREEAFMSNLVRKVPILKQVAAASERHMTTYLNLLRTAAFDQFVAANPNATQAELKAWAAFVNVASGRGDLGRAAAISGELSTVIFSPRFTVSRFQTPWHLVKAGQSPRVRKAIAKDIAATLAIGGTALTLAAAAGFTVGTDPRESDFGKFRVGNTTVDVWGGLLQPARLIVGTAVSGTDRAGLTNPGKLGPTSPLELISRFAMTKLSPGVTVPLEVGFGVNIFGQETDRLDSAARAVVPLLFSDIYDAYQQGGDANALGVAVGSSLGLGMHTMTDAQIRKMEKRKRDREMTR